MSELKKAAPGNVAMLMADKQARAYQNGRNEVLVWHSIYEAENELLRLVDQVVHAVLLLYGLPEAQQVARWRVEFRPRGSTPSMDRQLLQAVYDLRLVQRESTPALASLPWNGPHLAVIDEQIADLIVFAGQLGSAIAALLSELQPDETGQQLRQCVTARGGEDLREFLLDLRDSIPRPGRPKGSSDPINDFILEAADRLERSHHPRSQGAVMVLLMKELALREDVKRWLQARTPVQAEAVEVQAFVKFLSIRNDQAALGKELRELRRNRRRAEAR